MSDARKGRRGRRALEAAAEVHVQVGPAGAAPPNVVVDLATPTSTDPPTAPGKDSALLGGENGTGSLPRKKLSSQSYREAVGGKSLADKYRQVSGLGSRLQCFMQLVVIHLHCSFPFVLQHTACPCHPYIRSL